MDKCIKCFSLYIYIYIYFIYIYIYEHVSNDVIHRHIKLMYTV